MLRVLKQVANAKIIGNFIKMKLGNHKHEKSMETKTHNGIFLPPSNDDALIYVNSFVCLYQNSNH